MENLFSSVLVQFGELKSQYPEPQQLMAQTAELLRTRIPHYDWVGFYLLDSPNNMLVLGPYSGKPTEHTHIPVGKGVCGQVAESKQSMIVQDVSQQTNYIACSMDVQSEIVVPVIKNGQFVAEIDIDSHAFAPFTKEDELFLTSIADQLAIYF
ncbi:MAG: GAF domain-containing protein [Prolixibacteraceae bacterium]